MYANRVSWILLVFTVMAAPLPFGSTEPFIVAFWCTVLGLALTCCSLRDLRSQHSLFFTFLAVLVAAFIFVLHEQTASSPWMATFSPLWTEAGQALAEHIPESAAVAWNKPWFSLGGPLLVVLALTVSFIVNSDRVLARRFFLTLAWGGAAYAIYSIAAFLIDPTKVLWREKVAHVHALTGTFTNRNTAADFFGTFSIIWLLLVLEQAQRLMPSRRLSPQAVARRLLNHAPRFLIVSFTMLLLCMAAMFLTASRAGVVFSLLAILIAVVCSFRQYLSTRAGVASLVFITGAILLVLMQTMGSGVGNRFDLDGVVDDARLEGYRSTINMIRDHPLFGTGLGTFDLAFPAYRSDQISLWGTWNRAHNTFLEIASDLGIPLAVLIASGWVLVVWRLALGVMQRRRDVVLPIAGLAVCFLGLTHSLVDFSLQIPGYAILFSGVVGMGLAQSFSSKAPLPGSVKTTDPDELAL